MNLNLRGVIPALVSPLTDDGSLDSRSIPRLVEFLLERRMNGFFVGGSTGEGFCLDFDERKELLEKVVVQVGGRVPVIAHVGSLNSREVRRLARHAHESGANAVSSVLPFYYKYSMDEIVDYYRMLADESGLAVIVYVLTESSNLPCSPETFVDRIAAIQAVQGVKYTGSDIFMVQRLCQLAKGRMQVYGGNDQVPLPMLIAGVTALIGSNFNSIPELWRNVYDAFAAGDLRQAVAAQDYLTSILAKIKHTAPVARAKYFLRLRKIPVGAARFPQSGLSLEHRNLLETVVAELERKKILETASAEPATA